MKWRLGPPSRCALSSKHQYGSWIVRGTRHHCIALFLAAGGTLLARSQRSDVRSEGGGAHNERGVPAPCSLAESVVHDLEPQWIHRKAPSSNFDGRGECSLQAEPPVIWRGMKRQSQSNEQGVVELGWGVAPFRSFSTPLSTPGTPTERPPNRAASSSE